MRIPSTLVSAASAVALVGGLTVAPASAALLHNEHLDEVGSEPFLSCDGIEAEVSWNDRVHVMITSRGRGGPLRFAANVHGSTVFTNAETGKTYMNLYSLRDADAAVTDHGDGTRTIRVAVTGGSRWLGADGKRLLTGAGRFSFQLTVHDGGTPDDLTDDQEVEGTFVFLGHRGIDQTAGRDFCADLAAATA